MSEESPPAKSEAPALVGEEAAGKEGENNKLSKNQLKKLKKNKVWTAVMWRQPR